MLKAENPGPANKFPFALIRMDGTSHAKKVMNTPEKTRFNDHHDYLFMALGFEWAMVTTRRAFNIPENYPFVGFGSSLVVPVRRTTDRAFIDEIRMRVPL